jgi:hypothetical protein
MRAAGLAGGAFHILYNIGEANSSKSTTAFDTSGRGKELVMALQIYYERKDIVTSILPLLRRAASGQSHWGSQILTARGHFEPKIPRHCLKTPLNRVINFIFEHLKSYYWRHQQN